MMKRINRRNPYTCLLFRHIDYFLWWLRGQKVFWAKNSGHLCKRYSKGHGGELKTHFPASWYRWACHIQNKYLWTRKILSLEIIYNTRWWEWNKI